MESGRQKEERVALWLFFGEGEAGKNCLGLLRIWKSLLVFAIFGELEGWNFSRCGSVSFLLERGCFVSMFLLGLAMVLNSGELLLGLRLRPTSKSRRLRSVDLTIFLRMADWVISMGAYFDIFKFVRLYYSRECYGDYCNIFVMGGKESSTARWPVISLEHWHEVELANSRRKVAYGQFKILMNSLTNQRIQQYGLIFQNGQEMQQYLQSFVWRQREEHIINTRYFQPVKEESFCGSRIYSRVYIQHTPYRLSSINDIPLPENLYILCSALLGFQKLYELIGYFRPNEDMLGIDCEGRVKVWLNSDFSKNYLFGPHYYQGIVEEDECSEEKMVREIVDMVEENTAYENCRLPKFASFLGNQAQLTFNSAYQQVLSYAKRHKIAIPKYFVSLVNLLQQRSNYSDDSKQSSVSASQAPFKVSESNIQNNRTNMVYYMDPSLDSSQAVISNQPKEQPREIKVEHECLEMPADTTGETFIKNNYSISTQVIKPREFRNSQLPKIIFNYSSKDISTPTQEYITSHQASRYTTTPQFHLPLSRIAQQKLQESVEQTRRLTYSDNYEDYFLDEQLVDDMAKYLN